MSRMSRLCSAAIFLTTGEERVWRNSSTVMSARLGDVPEETAEAGGGELAEGAEDGGDTGAAGEGAGEGDGVGRGVACGGGGGGAAGGVGRGGSGVTGAAGGDGAGRGAGPVAPSAWGDAAGDDTAGAETGESGLAEGAEGDGTGEAGRAEGGDGGAGAGGAGAGGDATASPSAAMTPTTVLTGTVAPVWTRISFRVPEAGAGISASTLSVEISKSGSSRCTLSPMFFIHFVMVPSAMDSPIWGMMTSVMRSPFQ
jgi:hypothetical protein